MKKTLSLLLALTMFMGAFGMTAIFGGVIGAGAVFYDYYEYTQIPGFTAFTDAELQIAWAAKCEHGVFTSTNLPEGDVVDKVASFSCISPGQYGEISFSTMELKNALPESNSWGQQFNSNVWGANDTIGGKDIFGDTGATMEDAAGFCAWVGLNDGAYTQQVKIQVFAAPSKGPAYVKSDNGSTDMADYGTGFVYECDGVYPDENGYIYYDFKTDFYQADWWSKDDEGVNWYRVDTNTKCPIPQSKIPQITGISFTVFGVSAGDVFHIGDLRTYKDTRIHVDELDEYITLFDSLDPEAYTEESYTAATDVYLSAYEMLMDYEGYTQKQIDAKVLELKTSINDLKPMFQAKDTTISLAGFEVWDDTDLEDTIPSGGICIDASAREEMIVPPGKDSSVMIMANAQDGPPTYGWSLFTSSIEGDAGVEAVKNPLEALEGSEPLSASSGVRFWLKWDETMNPVPSAMMFGLGSSTSQVYFEAEDSYITLPEASGYVGIPWSAFFDYEGEADIYDYIDELDYITIKIEGASGIYYIGDFHAFKWDVSSADFSALVEKINQTYTYMAGISENDYTPRSWKRLEDAIAAGEALIGVYGTTQEEVDEATADITSAVNRLGLIMDLAPLEMQNEMEALIKSAKNYWKGNVTGTSYRELMLAYEEGDTLLDKGPTLAEATASIARLKAATSGLVPIAAGDKVTSILSFENYTSRNLSKATGDRTEGVTYSLDTTFDKLPEGYTQALKMEAMVNLSSGSTDEHGLMQFKSMYRDSSNNPIPIMIGPNRENTLIGDLTGTDGICLWVGVNDVALVQECFFRFAVSNCTVGPLFENAAINIPIPPTGNGWIYIPWEYFEFYDEWTHGQPTDLAKIYFYILRFDGIIKQGLSVYVTGIHAYKNVTNGSWAQPVIDGITEGQEIDITEAGSFIPDWSEGSATLNNEFFVYGSSITKNGDYTLKVTNGDKSTSVNFTIVGGEGQVYTVPVVNIEDGGEYTVGQTVSWDVGTATLNGEVFTKGSTIDEAGSYTLVVTNGDKVVTIAFTVIEDTPPVMVGDFDGDGELTVADALAALRIAARLVEVTPETLEIGDTDGDGSVTVADALAILRVAARLATSL